MRPQSRHTSEISLGWRIGTDTGRDGCRCVENTTVWCEEQHTHPHATYETAHSPRTPGQHKISAPGAIEGCRVSVAAPCHACGSCGERVGDLEEISEGHRQKYCNRINSRVRHPLKTSGPAYIQTKPPGTCLYCCFLQEQRFNVKNTHTHKKRNPPPCVPGTCYRG